MAEVTIEVSEGYRRIMEERLSLQGIRQMGQEMISKGALLAEAIMKQTASATPFKESVGVYYTSIFKRVLGDTAEISPAVAYAGWLERGGAHPRWGVATSFRGYNIVQNAEQAFIPEYVQLCEQILKDKLK